MTQSARLRFATTITVLLFTTLLSPLTAQAQRPEPPGDILPSGIQTAYYRADVLNTGLATPPLSFNRQTPQATVDHFMRAADAGKYATAVHALNLNRVPVDEQAAAGPELAQRLHYIIAQQSLINWADLPDRLDGQIEPGVQGDESLAGQPRRSILIGTLEVNDRPVELRVQRVQAGDEEPVWVFAPRTVEQIDLLYAQYGPGTLDQQLPEWAQIQLGSIPIWEWAVLGLLLLASTGIGVVTQRGVCWLLRHTRHPWSQGLTAYLAGPVALLVGAFVFYIATQTLLSPSGPLLIALPPLLILLLIGGFTWLGMHLINFLSDYAGKSYIDRVNSADEERARRYRTNLVVARLVLVFLALMVGLGVAISQFTMLRDLGTSILASASVMAVIVGIAAQKVLGNILAGVQIAITQPVRIGDSVNFEDQWGFVEEINYSYVTIRTWDMRRFVVPLQYFITHPIENWTKTDSHLMRPIYLYVDYRIDVEKVRQKFSELLEGSDDWDRQVPPIVQVTDAKEQTIEIRALCSARDAPTAWDLHCWLREELVAFVRDLEDGLYLPRQRLLVGDLHQQVPQPATRENRNQAELRDSPVEVP